MSKTFKRGDHVAWNSEAGRVRGTVMKKAVSDVKIKGYIHHATKKEPQYFIKSDKSDHVALHKGMNRPMKNTSPDWQAEPQTQRRNGVRMETVSGLLLAPCWFDQALALFLISYIVAC